MWKFAGPTAAVLTLLVICGRFRYNFRDYFHSFSAFVSWETWSRLLVEKWAVLGLGFAAWCMISAARSEAKRLWVILVSLFSTNNIPADWKEIEGRNLIIGLFLGFNFLFIALFLALILAEYFAITITLFYFLSYLNHCCHVPYTLEVIRDPKNLPPDDDKRKPYILERRLLAEAFLTSRPLIGKEVALTVMWLVISGVAFARAWDFFAFRAESLYLAMIIGILINEVVVYRWRLWRDANFEVIGQQEERRLLG